MSGASAEQYHPGLEGVIASETAIANIEGKDGAGGLEYRGYRIEDLAGHVSYEETAFLLLHGDLPNRGQLREFDARLRRCAGDPRAADRACSRRFPRHVHPMDVLRSSVSVLAHFDPDVNAPPTDHAANVRKAERMVAQMATAVAFRERIAKGLPVIPPRDDLDHAANFLNMVNGKVPSPTMREAFDLSMVLYTEHELNASTFAARVTVSTLSDIYSGIVAAIGTLKGPLHGGANEEAWKVLEQVGSPENAERWIKDALARKERIMGFGHRVYKTGDPRATILKQYCIELAQGSRRRPLGADRRADRAGRHHPEAPAAQRRLAQCPALSLHGPGHRPLHADLRHGPGRRLGGPRHRAARPQPPDAAAGALYRPAAPPGQADRRRGERRSRRRPCVSGNRALVQAAVQLEPPVAGRSVTLAVRHLTWQHGRCRRLASVGSPAAVFGVIALLLGRRLWPWHRLGLRPRRASSSFISSARASSVLASRPWRLGGAGLACASIGRRGAVKRAMALVSTASARPTIGGVHVVTEEASSRSIVIGRMPLSRASLMTSPTRLFELGLRDARPSRFWW